LFQIFQKIEDLNISIKQIPMIQQKILIRTLEIEKHVKHFQIMNIES